jgi:ABC-type oligopeptide transport system substrate-binding subunit
MRVRVFSDLRTPALSSLVRLLRKLGYRASPLIVPGRRYARTVSDSRKMLQIAASGWVADYPAASHFFDAKLSCRAYRRANPTNNNDSGFRDPRIEANAERARPAGRKRSARRQPPLAARVPRHVDQAPWLVAVTPRQIDLISSRTGN